MHRTIIVHPDQSTFGTLGKVAFMKDVSTRLPVVESSEKFEADQAAMQSASNR